MNRNEKTMNKKIKIIAVAASSMGIATTGLVIIGKFIPSITPFRADVVTLINDVNEKVIVPKSTIKEEQKQGKELLKSLALMVQQDITNSSKPVERSSILACNEAIAKSNEAGTAMTSANSMRESPYMASIVSQYESEAQTAMVASNELENNCQKEIKTAQKAKDEVKRIANSQKQLIRISSEAGAHIKYTPTYSYKIIVTDVNGKSNVINQAVTCLNTNAENIFTKETRRNIAPHSFVEFSKPSQMTIVSNAAPLLNTSAYAGSVIPTVDAINFASQEVCKYKGHIGIEKDFSKDTL